MCLKLSTKLHGTRAHFERLKDGGGGASRLQHVLMCPKEESNQGKVHVACIKDEGEIFDIPKCVVRPSKRRRE